MLHNHDLSVWEIAYRWNGIEPSSNPLMRMPSPAKDTCRRLLDAVLNYRLNFMNVSMEKRPPNSENPSEFFIRTHLDALYACVDHARCPRRLLQFFRIDRAALRAWCESEGVPLPAFWFSADTPITVNKAPFPSRRSAKPRPSTLAREATRKRATKLWRQHPQHNITQMVATLRKAGEPGAPYVGNTVRGWIRGLAPAGIAGRRGRPKGRKNTPPDDKK